MLDVITRLRVHAQERPDAVAVQQVAPACAAINPLTWRELWNSVTALAQQLQSLSEPGDIMLVASPNRPEFVVSFLAGIAADLTVFPVHPASASSEVEAAARRSNATICVAPQSVCDALANVCEHRIGLHAVMEQAFVSKIVRCEEDAAMLLQSSGTTGRPKIVHRNASALQAVTQNVVDGVGLTSGDHVLAAVPLCHSYGVESALLAPIHAGAAIHLCDGFDPATVCRAVESGTITVLPGVPFMFEALAERCREAPNLRMAYSAGSPLPPPVFDQMYERLGVRVGQLYGSTETGAVTFNHPSQRGGFNPCSVGLPMAGVEVRIIDSESPNPSHSLSIGEIGQIAIAATSMLDRFVDDSTPHLTDGYYMTGDLGFIDDHGELTITGRVKLQIDVGGLKVNPIEVEQVMLLHDAVCECVVVPLAVSNTLNRLRSVVALKPGHQSVTPDELREFLRSRLAPYKVPRIIEVRESLPKSSTGKILREALRCE